MKINIYYGGRGLIEDSTLYVLQKITEVLEELRVQVSRYNLYESKHEIATLASTIKDADGIILAASVEWYGIGGLLQTFLDACWLYGDKKKIASTYMMPVSIAGAYGEREAETYLNRSWEILGGLLCPGITAYVADQTEFETNPDYAKIIEKRAEDLYRTIKQEPKTFPTSTKALLQTRVEPASMQLTPQESEQLSKYVSDDSFVKKQREDIDELSELFKGLMGSGESGQEFIKNFKENFIAGNDANVSFLIKMTDTEKNLAVEVQNGRLRVFYGDLESPDVVATTTREIVNRIVMGRTTFQGAFMTGAMSTKGDFKAVRQFDQLFRFTKI